MTKKALYILSVVACAAGYVWLAVSSIHAEEGVWRGCMWFYTSPHCTLSRALERIIVTQPEWYVAGSIDVAASCVDLIGYHQAGRFFFSFLSMD